MDRDVCFLAYFICGATGLAVAVAGGLAPSFFSALFSSFRACAGGFSFAADGPGPTARGLSDPPAIVLHRLLVRGPKKKATLEFITFLSPPVASAGPRNGRENLKLRRLGAAAPPLDDRVASAESEPNKRHQKPASTPRCAWWHDGRFRVSGLSAHGLTGDRRQ